MYGRAGVKMQEKIRRRRRSAAIARAMLHRIRMIRLQAMRRRVRSSAVRRPMYNLYRWKNSRYFGRR